MLDIIVIGALAHVHTLYNLSQSHADEPDEHETEVERSSNRSFVAGQEERCVDDSIPCDPP
jgi:hypothetical protein